MMKQTRMIRISFFIVTALIICAFWGGFYFGGSLSGNADSGIQIASVEDQTQEAANQNADDKKENTVAKNETVESMNALSEEKYYLKALISRRLYYQVIRGVIHQRCNLSEVRI